MKPSSILFVKGFPLSKWYPFPKKDGNLSLSFFLGESNILTLKAKEQKTQKSKRTALIINNKNMYFELH